MIVFMAFQELGIKESIFKICATYIGVALSDECTAVCPGQLTTSEVLHKT